MTTTSRRTVNLSKVEKVASRKEDGKTQILSVSGMKGEQGLLSTVYSYLLELLSCRRFSRLEKGGSCLRANRGNAKRRFVGDKGTGHKGGSKCRRGQDKEGSRRELHDCCLLFYERVWWWRDEAMGDERKKVRKKDDDVVMVVSILCDARQPFPWTSPCLFRIDWPRTDVTSTRGKKRRGGSTDGTQDLMCAEPRVNNSRSCDTSETEREVAWPCESSPHLLQQTRTWKVTTSRTLPSKM